MHNVQYNAYQRLTSHYPPQPRYVKVTGPVAIARFQPYSRRPQTQLSQVTFYST